MENNTKQPAEIRLTPKEIYKAVANYLSNTLCIDRKMITDILDKKIEERMPDKLIEKAVDRYFEQTPGKGWNADTQVKVQIDKIIREQVQAKMANGGIKYLDNQIQESLDNIFGISPKKHAGTIMPRPHLTVFGGAVCLEKPLVETIAMKWMTDSGLSSAGLHYRITYGNDMTCTMTITDITDEAKKKESVLAFLNALPEGDRQEIFGIFAKTETDMPAYMFSNMIAKELGDIFISRIIALPDEIVCIYD